MLAQSLDLSDKEFQLFREIIYRETGIHMSDKKAHRRQTLQEAQGFKSEHVHRILQLSESKPGLRYRNREPGQPGHDKQDRFFRERHHFDFLLKELYPRVIEEGRRSGSRKLRIWSAGCSSGEEPYTLAMVTLEAFKAERGWDIKILATDLDTEILGKAITGVYQTQAVTPVPRNISSNISSARGTLRSGRRAPVNGLIQKAQPYG